MHQLNQQAYESGIFSGIGTLGVGQPPPVHAYRDGSLGQPPPVHAYRDGSLGVLSGAGGLGQPPPVHAYRDGSLGQSQAGTVTTAVAALGALAVIGWAAKQWGWI